MTSRLTLPRLLPLTIVVMLLLLSAKAVTFAKEAGTALGLIPGAATPQTVALANAPEAISGPVTVIKQPAPPQEVSESEKELLQDLRKRREQLDARARALEERNGVIEATEASLQAKLEHLTSLEDRIGQLDSARKKRQDANWGGLVKVYESMKPRDAAAIFDVLDMHVLLEVLDRMNERKAAAILAAMQPERARMATQMLAQKRLQQETTTSQIASDTPPKPHTEQ